MGRHVLWPLQPGESRSIWTTLRTIAHAEGPKAFWRGVFPRTVYMGLGGTVYLGTYSFMSATLIRIVGD